MRHFNNSIVVALATLLLLVSISSAQQTATTSVPNLIRYSGTLKDVQGAGPSSSTAVGVTFSIYKQQDGGASVWMETQNVTPDANGQYSAILGSTTATGLPDDLFLQQEQRWLGVQIQGEAEQPRVLLVSVPYAFKAHEADTLGGLPASAFVKAPPRDASGSTGTDTGTAVNALSGPGNANISSKGKSAASRNNTICAALTANASANFIPLFDPTVCNLVNSTIYQLGSNLGIGTKIPSTALEVNGAITADQWYDITTAESPFLSIGWPPVRVLATNQNTWLGLGAGGQGTNPNDSGTMNTFTGYTAGFGNTTGSQNSCYGNAACLHNLTGIENVAVGAGAGFRNDAGSNNTYVGFDSGWTNSGNINNNTFSGWESGFANSGSNNVFYGYKAGAANTANGNSFLGYQSGLMNTTGFDNTFVGFNSGMSNQDANGSTTFGQENTFVGYNAGAGSKTSQGNTFVGSNAGLVSGSVNANDCCNTFVGKNAGMTSQTSNNTMVGYRAGESTTGGTNTLVGNKAGAANTTGQFNTFFGASAGFNDTSMTGNTTGSQNTYVGVATGASGSTKTGNNNIFLGYGAGVAEGNVSNNIEIGNTGPTYEVGNWTGCLVLPCSNQILIGTKGTQTDTYIQGIYGAAMPPLYPSKSVCVDSNGKLWGGHINDPHCDIIVSSRRFKEQIRDMGDNSSKLFQLRPVSFFYKPQYDDGSHSLQYGLIAEEVATVYPEMAVYDKDGQPYSVKYQLLAPMLLNELQKEHTVVMAQQDELQTQLQQIKTQRQEIDGLKLQLQQQNASLQERLSKLESYVATQMKVASDNPPRTTPGANGGLQ